jgi:hypothetical protein
MTIKVIVEPSLLTCVGRLPESSRQAIQDCCDRLGQCLCITDVSNHFYVENVTETRLDIRLSNTISLVFRRKPRLFFKSETLVFEDIIQKDESPSRSKKDANIKQLGKLVRFFSYINQAVAQADQFLNYPQLLNGLLFLLVTLLLWIGGNRSLPERLPIFEANPATLHSPSQE